MPACDSASQLALVERRARPAARLRSQLVDAVAAPRHGRSAMRAEQRPRPRARAASARPTSRRRRPRSTRARSRRRLTLRPASAPRGACRRTVDHPLDDGDHRGRRRAATAPTAWTYGTPKPGRGRSRRSDGDEPLGALGDADVARSCRGPRRAPWRRRRPSPPTRQKSVTPARTVSSPSPTNHSSERAEDRRVGDPVERRVEERAPRCWTARTAGPSCRRAVSEKTKAVMTIVPEKNSPRG